MHPDDRERTRESAARLREGERTAPLLNRYCTKDGGSRWIEWSSTFDRAQELIYAAARDVTDRVEAEEGMRQAEERFRRAFEDSPAGMALVGVRGEDAGRILEVNDALVDLTGLAHEELVGTSSLQDLTHLDDAGFVSEGLERLVAGEIPILRLEFRLRGLAGQVRWVDLTASLVHGADGEPLYRISQLQDIDARRRGEEMLRHLADHDTLSGLFNRRRFQEELEREVERGGRGAVLLIDLDKFKEVNDTLGHAAGDAVIQKVGESLKDRLRTSDVTARLGGDEFGIILRRVGPAEADRVAAEMLEHVEAALHETTEGAEVSLSIGLAPFDRGDGRGAGRAAAGRRRGDVSREGPRRRCRRARRLAGVRPGRHRVVALRADRRRRARCGSPRRHAMRSRAARKSWRGDQPSSSRALALTYTRSMLGSRRQPRAAKTASASGTRRRTTAGASVRSSARSSRVNGVVALTM